MASTFLTLTNRALRRLNEVELTASNFANATGFQALAKDAVNDAIHFINQEEFQWPFNHTEGTQVMTVSPSIVQKYALPTGFKDVDWQTFFLQRDSGLSTPVEGRHLRLKTYDEWVRHFRSDDEQIIANVGSGTYFPKLIIPTQDESFIVSPPPSQAYTIKYEYWAPPTVLVNDTDTTNIPSRFDRVIIDGAMMEAYMFRENLEASNVAQSKFLRGIAHMRTQLINKYEYAYDTRTPQSLRRI